jgi:hypothetical protein
MKTSKIKTAGVVKEWNGQHGLIYFHPITLENGDEGSIGTKDESPDWLKVGESLDYTLTETDNGNKIKKFSQPKGGGSYNQTWAESMRITRDACYGAACAHYAGKIAKTPEEVKELADRFVKFVIHGTPQEDFPKWGDVHQNLIHRSASVKHGAAIGDTPDECVKYALESINYIG